MQGGLYSHMHYYSFLTVFYQICQQFFDLREIEGFFQSWLMLLH